MRFALAVDDDLRPFYERFRFDPLLGRAVRARPLLRVRRRPEPFEALAWAICEQLIEAERAAAIQRRIVAALGPALPANRFAGRAGRRRAWPAWRPPSSRRSTCPAPVRWRCVALRGRWPPAASTCGRPTTSAAGGGCGRSPASAPGPWSRSRCTARAATTSSRPATSPTSSSSAACAPGTPGRAPTSPRCASSSRPTRPGRGSSARTCWRARRMLPHARHSPCPGRNSFVSASAAFGGRVSSLLREHPVAVGRPQARVLVAERPRRAGGEEPAASPSPTRAGAWAGGRDWPPTQRLDARAGSRRAARSRGAARMKRRIVAPLARGLARATNTSSS